MQSADSSLILSLHVLGDHFCKKRVILLWIDSWTQMAARYGASLLNVWSCLFVEDWWLANKYVMEEDSWTGSVVFPTQTPQ